MVQFGYASSEPGLDWFNKPRFTNQTELVVTEPFKVNRSAEALLELPGGLLGLQVPPLVNVQGSSLYPTPTSREEPTLSLSTKLCALHHELGLKFSCGAAPAEGTKFHRVHYPGVPLARDTRRRMTCTAPGCHSPGASFCALHFRAHARPRNFA